MLLGVDADVYFTGEMSHVRLNTRRSWGSRIKLIYNAPARSSSRRGFWKERHIV
jgi:hypothetical protein